MDTADVREVRARVLEEVAEELESRRKLPPERNRWQRFWHGRGGSETVMKAEGLRLRADRIRRGDPIRMEPSESPPVASFIVTPSSGTPPLSTVFTDTSTGMPTSWSWDFGDGSGSTEQNPSHSFAGIGSYAVTLTAANGSGTSAYTRTAAVSESR